MSSQSFVLFIFFVFPKTCHPVNSSQPKFKASREAEGCGNWYCSRQMSFRTWFHGNLVLNTCYFDLKANYEGVEPKSEMNKKNFHWFYRDGCQKELTNHEPMQR